MDVVAITTTVGEPELARAIASVQRQDRPPRSHLVVFDGQPSPAQLSWISGLGDLKVPVRVVCTGRRMGDERVVGWPAYVHGIEEHLSPDTYVAFLDADNIWLRGHLNSLVARIEAAGSPAAGSLRFVWDPRSRTMLEDLGESLVTRPRAMHLWAQQGILDDDLRDFYLAHPFLTDTSSLLISVKYFMQHSQFVLSEFGDAILASHLVDDGAIVRGIRTCIYSLGSPRSGSIDHFQAANSLVTDGQDAEYLGGDFGG